MRLNVGQSWDICRRRPSSVLLTLCTAALHLQVEGDVVELEQTRPPERPSVVVVQSPGVLDLLLVGQRFVHVVVATLGAEDVRGQVGDTHLLVTRPVRTPHQAEPAGLLVLLYGAD